MKPITYDTPGRVELDLRISAGAIEIAAAPTDETVIEIVGERSPGDVRVERSDLPRGGQRITVKQRGSWRRSDVRVRISTREGADVRCESGGADLDARGRLGSLTFRSGSGDVVFEVLDRDVALSVASGDVRGDAVGGSVDVDSASGDVELGAVQGDVTGHLASGSFRATSVGGSVKLRSASGDISVGAVALGSVSLTSMSGDVSVGVRPGTRVWLDLSSVSGSAASELDAADEPAGGPALELRASSVSGDVRVTRSTAA